MNIGVSFHKEDDDGLYFLHFLVVHIYVFHTELFTSNDIEVDGERDVDELDDDSEKDDNIEPTRTYLFAKCYTRNGGTSNVVVADSLVRWCLQKLI